MSGRKSRLPAAAERWNTTGLAGGVSDALHDRRTGQSVQGVTRRQGVHTTPAVLLGPEGVLVGGLDGLGTVAVADGQFGNRRVGDLDPLRHRLDRQNNPKHPSKQVISIVAPANQSSHEKCQTVHGRQSCKVPEDGFQKSPMPDSTN